MEQVFRPTDLEMSFESPYLPGFKLKRFYAIEVRVYRDSTKDDVIGIHTQYVRIG